MLGFPGWFRTWQCCSVSQSAQLGTGIRGCASPPKVEWAPCWGSLGSGGVWSGSLQLSHHGLCQAIRVGGVWQDLGVYYPHSFVSSSLVEGTQAPVPYLGACRVPQPRSGQVPDIFANNSLLHKKWLKHQEFMLHTIHCGLQAHAQLS